MKSNNQQCHEAMGLCWHEYLCESADPADHFNDRCIKCVCTYGAFDESADFDSAISSLKFNTNPDYENSIQDAWKLVEWMNNKPLDIEVSWLSGDPVCVTVTRWKGATGYEFYGTSDTAPKAIVAAFLKAIEVSDD